MSSVKYISYILNTTMLLVKFEKKIAFNYSLLVNKILTIYESNQNVFDSVVNIDSQHYTLLLEFNETITPYLNALDIYIDGELSFEEEETVRNEITPYRESFYSKLSLFLLSYANMQCGSVKISVSEDISSIMGLIENIITPENINQKKTMTELGYENVACLDNCSTGSYTFLTTENRISVLYGLEIQNTFLENVSTLFYGFMNNLDSVSQTINYLHEDLIPQIYSNFEIINSNFDKIIIEINYLNDVLSLEKIILTEKYTINYLYISYSIVYYVYNINTLFNTIYTYINDN